MTTERSPPYKRRTPTNEPELLEIWETLYRELTEEQDMKKSTAFETIGKQYGVCRATVMYHLEKFSDRKKERKKYASDRWHNETKGTDKIKKENPYKTRYMSARRHIDHHIRAAYTHVAPQDCMTMAELSDAINEVTGISFNPHKILPVLIEQIEHANGYRILKEVGGTDPVRYRLLNAAI